MRSEHLVDPLCAICGSGRSMDRAAQSMDPYFAQSHKMQYIYCVWLKVVFASESIWSDVLNEAGWKQ